jgi:predicted enzyme related to lactoylglutathione lyase
MANEIVHWEFMGPDGAAITSFYENLFGWKSEGVPGFDGYNLIGADQAGIGGAVGQGSETMPAYVTVYVQVDDVTEYLAKAEAGGGGTVMPRTVVPGMVTFGLFSDPAGNIVGVVEAEMPPAE